MLLYVSAYIYVFVINDSIIFESFFNNQILTIVVIFSEIILAISSILSILLSIKIDLILVFDLNRWALSNFFLVKIMLYKLFNVLVIFLVIQTICTATYTNISEENYLDIQQIGN